MNKIEKKVRAELKKVRKEYFKEEDTLKHLYLSGRLVALIDVLVWILTEENLK